MEIRPNLLTASIQVALHMQYDYFVACVNASLAKKEAKP
jgi:hypothetical protein